MDKIIRRRNEKTYEKRVGRPSINSQKSSVSLPTNIGDSSEDNKHQVPNIISKNDSRKELSKITGVPETRLETTIEVGKLAETGKTKTVRREEERRQEEELEKEEEEERLEKERKRIEEEFKIDPDFKTIIPPQRALHLKSYF
jgi:hypothetical protein